VAVVKDGTAHIPQGVGDARFGTQVEVDDGVEQGDLVIINPPLPLARAASTGSRRPRRTKNVGGRPDDPPACPCPLL